LLSLSYMEQDPREKYADWKAPEASAEVTQEVFINESEKAKFRELSESIRDLAYRLKKRDGLRFDPLIEQGGIDRLSAAAVEIEELSGNPKAKFEEYEDALSKLAFALRAFGKAPGRSMLREDTDNLRKINFLIKGVGEPVRALRGSLGAREQQTLQPTLVKLKEVNDALEKIWQWIAKKSSLIEGRR